MGKRHPSHPDAFTMSLGDHLDELRKRVLLALIVPLPLACIIFFFSKQLIDLLKLPLERVLISQGLPATLQQLHPAEVVILQLKLSVIAAIVLSFPWILWQLWKFIQPGLYAHERRFVYLLIPGSFVLSIAGTLLLYFVMLPLILNVLVSMGSSLRNAPPPVQDPRVDEVLAAQPFIEIRTQPPAPISVGQAWLQWPDLKLHVVVPGTPTPEGGASPPEVMEVMRGVQVGLRQEFQVSTYVSFVLLLLLGVVIAFQMPMVILLLGWVGLASADWLAARRKYALFICGIIAAVVTPTADIVSMLVMLVPLYGLYELGVILLRVFPAKAVAEGRRWSWRRGDKHAAQTAQIRRPERPAESIARKEPVGTAASQFHPGPTDDSPEEPRP